MWCYSLRRPGPTLTQMQLRGQEGTEEALSWPRLSRYMLLQNSAQSPP